MDGVVVAVRARAPCKRFAIKDNGICDRSAHGFEGHNAKLHSFFSLRTVRGVTRPSSNLMRVRSGLPTNEWGVDSKCECYRDQQTTSFPSILARYATQAVPFQSCSL